MDIPKEARKCPRCHHFQNRATMLMHHPAFAAVGLAVPIVVMMTAFAMIFDTGEEYAAYKDQIMIRENQLVFGETKSGKTVSVIGTIQNRSPVAWKDLQFHVEFQDAEGRRMDVGFKEPSSSYLPANGTISFKISFPMEFPESDYAKAVAKVANAKEANVMW